VTQASPESQREHLSPDGRWRWDGSQWVPAQGAPQWVPPQSAPPMPGPVQGSAAGPPPVQRPAAGRAPATQGLGYQFGGSAMWSLIFGAASVVVPFITIGGQGIYFPILPIFGLWRAVLAIRAGRVLGGVVGLVLNALGCLVSLLASGLLNSALH
jgi:hypothetical protein